MEYLIHLNHVHYALGALAFAVRDIFYLRCISIAASLTVIFYSLTVVESWIAPVAWHCFFIAVNGTRVALLVYGERMAKFTEDERELYETLFRGFTKLEFMKLLRQGAWKRAKPGTVLARESQELAEVMLISNGILKVEAEGKEVAEVRDGQFIGEMSFLTGEAASATVTVVEPTKYLAWRKGDLADLLDRNPSMRFAIDKVFGVDLSRKLRKRPKAGQKGPAA